MDTEPADVEPASEAEAERVQSKKPEVVEILFEQLLGRDKWPTERRLIVDSNKLVAAIRKRNGRHKREKKLSTKNPANFLKDFIRKKTCNANWPRKLSKLHVTARQVYGDQQVFEFVAFGAGDVLPFPDRFEPKENIELFPFEALSVPVEARKLGRQDEPWLIQVAVNLRLIEAHLAIQSARAGLRVQSLAHLQVAVKTQPEIDATFVATVLSNTDERLRVYVTVEAKQFGERILEHQIREQIGIAFSSTEPLTGEDKIEAVLPLVLKVVEKPEPTDQRKTGSRCIYIAQFKMVEREDFEANYADKLHDLPLEIQSSGLYAAYPPISGMSTRVTRPKRPRSAAKPRRKRRR